MATRTNLSHADRIYRGQAYRANTTPDGRSGAAWSHIYVHEFGAVAARSATAVASAASVSAASALTLNGANTVTAGSAVAYWDRDVNPTLAAGVVDLGAACNVQINSAANLSGITFTFTGTDGYGNTVIETVTGPNATTVTGNKAFKTITAATVSGSMAGAASIGSGSKLGVPFRIPNKGTVLGTFVDGVGETNTIVAGLAATSVASATNADVRGTVQFNSAGNGTKMFTTKLLVDSTDDTLCYGVAQYAG